jgi:hypothetical protein
MTKGDADVAGNQQAHSSRAFDPAVLSRDFSAAVERQKLILPDSAARIARSFYGRRDDFPIHDAALLRINGHQIRIYEKSVSGLASRGAGLVGQRDIFAILRAVGCEHVAHV